MLHSLCLLSVVCVFHLCIMFGVAAEILLSPFQSLRMPPRITNVQTNTLANIQADIHTRKHTRSSPQATPAPTPAYTLIGNGACRGTDSSHNPTSWYTTTSANDVAECESLCDSASVPSCVAIEFYFPTTTCELWSTMPQTVSGTSCTCECKVKATPMAATPATTPSPTRQPAPINPPTGQVMNGTRAKSK